MLEAAASGIRQTGPMRTKHTLLALVVVLIWGLNFVAIDEGLTDIPPLVFMAMRFVLVAFPAVFFIKRPAIGWRQVVLIGAFLSLGQFVLLYLALSLGMPAGLASLLLQTQVVLSVIVSAILLKERPSRRQLVGIIIGMAGLAVVVVGHSATAPWLPLVITLLAALSWAIGNVLSRRARVSSGLSLVVWSALVVPLPALALALLFDTPDDDRRLDHHDVSGRDRQHAVHRHRRITHRIRHLELAARPLPHERGGAVHPARAGHRHPRRVVGAGRAADCDRTDRRGDHAVGARGCGAARFGRSEPLADQPFATVTLTGVALAAADLTRPRTGGERMPLQHLTPLPGSPADQTQRAAASGSIRSPPHLFPT